MGRLILEYSPWLVPLCLLAGIGYALLLYSAKPLWGKQVNYLLFVLRALVVSLMAFLLLGPLFKYSTYRETPPSVVFLVDNSTSVGAVQGQQQAWGTDVLESLGAPLEDIGYQVHYQDLNNQPVDDSISWDVPGSDLTSALGKISAHFEGRNLSNIVLLSDGLYNMGLSPLYFPTNVPISTIGVGDTIPKADLVLKTLVYNKVAYEGNKFPLQVEVVARRMEGRSGVITVSHNGEELTRKAFHTGNKGWFRVDFEIEATAQGLQQFQVQILPLQGEQNTNNNVASAFVEVVKGKERIVLVAPAPHPDIRILREVIERNPNYEFIPIIEGISKTTITEALAETPSLVIVHDAYRGDNPIAQRSWSSLVIPNTNIPLFIVLAGWFNGQQLADDLPVKLEMRIGTSGTSEEITPILNEQYLNFTFPDNASGTVAMFPPVTVPFGKYGIPPSSEILLHQQVGNIPTNRPWLFSFLHEGRKVAMTLGNGFWKWRINEYARTSQTTVFDALFEKLIQYLCSQDDKRRFRCFPLQSEYNAGESVVMEARCLTACTN